MNDGRGKDLKRGASIERFLARSDSAVLEQPATGHALLDPGEYLTHGVLGNTIDETVLVGRARPDRIIMSSAAGERNGDFGR